MFAIILAGGLGKKLLPHTLFVPKPMAEIDGKPILEHQIKWLSQAGVTDVIIAQNYRSDIIKSYFDEEKQDELKINITHLDDEDENTGTIGVTRRALSKIPKDEKNVFVMAGDVLTDLDPNTLLNKHIFECTPFTIYTTLYQLPVGIIQHNDFGIITEFREKPKLVTNAGIGIIRRNDYLQLPENGGSFFEEAVQTFRDNTFAFHDSEAHWWHITESRDLENAENDFKQIREVEPHLSRGKEKF